MKTIVLDEGLILEVKPDECSDDPRSWDNLGKMVCFHKRYDLGDNNKPFKSEDFSSWAEQKEHIEKILKAAVVLPLYLYDHSGITISTTPFSCSWDSGQIGWIYATEESIIEEYGEVTEDAVEKATYILKNEVELYDNYLTGEVYSFILFKVEICDLGHEHHKEIDSCGGFYGRNFKENGLIEHIFSNELSEENKNKILEVLC